MEQTQTLRPGQPDANRIPKNALREVAPALPRPSWGDVWLVVGDERFAASQPMRGDITSRPWPGPGAVVSPDDERLITAGVANSALARLWSLTGKEASLQSADGRPLLALRLEKIDARFGVVVARVMDVPAAKAANG